MDSLGAFKAKYHMVASLEKKILQSSELMFFKRNDSIQENISKGLYFINSGLCRIYSISQGIEDTLQFRKENEVLVSTVAFGGNYNTEEYFQALEDTQALFLSWENVYRLSNKLPEMTLLIQQILISENTLLHKLLKEFRGLSTLQRYNKLMEETPYLIQRVPLNILASYLGMSKETLSRVRKQI